MGMGDLADIGGCGDAAEADAKTQDKTASKKLLPVGAWSLYTGADNNNQGASEHTPSSTKIIGNRASKKHGGNGAQVVHCKYQASAGSGNSPNR
jgi:hypothetical protein